MKRKKSPKSKAISAILRENGDKKTVFKLAFFGAIIFYIFNTLMSKLNREFFLFANIDDVYPYNIIFNLSFFILNFSFIIAIGFFISRKAMARKILNGALGGGLSFAFFVLINMIFTTISLLYYKFPMNWARVLVVSLIYLAVYFCLGFLLGALGAYTENKKEMLVLAR